MIDGRWDQGQLVFSGLRRTLTRRPTKERSEPELSFRAGILVIVPATMVHRQALRGVLALLALGADSLQRPVARRASFGGVSHHRGPSPVVASEASSVVVPGALCAAAVGPRRRVSALAANAALDENSVSGETFLGALYKFCRPHTIREARSVPQGRSSWRRARATRDRGLCFRWDDPGVLRGRRQGARRQRRHRGRLELGARPARGRGPRGAFVRERVHRWHQPALRRRGRQGEQALPAHRRRRAVARDGQGPARDLRRRRPDDRDSAAPFASFSPRGRKEGRTDTSSPRSRRSSRPSSSSSTPSGPSRGRRTACRRSR